MKRILLTLLTLAVVLPALPKTEASAQVSVNFFYDNLGSDGYWLDVDGYGYCWQPNVAVSNRSWRPYADGYWGYTDLGWTWISYEPFGWATYHYGRWARLRNHGWVWVPGYEWGPAWVSWRTGGNYVGWAPLPPRRYVSGGEVIYSGRPIGAHVDIEYDIGPSYYNFVDVRYIGAPVLSRHIYEPAQNITYINRTVNVTNITYNNSVVHNYGPDYERLSRYSARPIQRLKLQRNADAGRAGGRGANRVEGNTLMVAAPATIEKPAKRVAPPAVKTKVAEPDLETGWGDVADPKAKAEIQEKIKKEDPKTVPPPDVPPQNANNAEAGDQGASPADGAAGAKKNRGKNKDKTAESEQPADAATADAVATPAGADDATDRRKNRRKAKRQSADSDQAADAGSPDPTATPASADDTTGARKNRGKGKDKSADAEQSDDSATASPSPAGTDDVRGKGKGRGRPQQSPQPDATTGSDAQVTPSVAPESSPAPEGRAGKGKRGSQSPTGAPTSAPVNTPAAATAADSAGPSDAGRGNRGRNRKDAGRPDDVPAAPTPAQAAPQRERRAPQAADAGQAEGRVNRGQSKKAERTEAPSPAAEAPAPVRQPQTERVPQRAAQSQAAPPSAPAAARTAPPQSQGEAKGDRGNRKKKDAAASPTPGEEQ